jgi:hypothetical protein
MDRRRAHNKTITMLSGTLDMSSNEPHVTNHCPYCCAEWMAKVEKVSACPECGAPCEMETEQDGNISISWSMSPVLSKIVSMLSKHGFVVGRYGVERPSTGCSFAFNGLIKYKTVTDFQIEYPFYA